MKTLLSILATGIALNFSASGGEKSVRIDLRIERPPVEKKEAARGLLFKKTTWAVKADTKLSVLSKIGANFKTANFSEFIAPTAYAPFEVNGNVKITNREDGSVLLESAETSAVSGTLVNARNSSFPVTPVNSTAFEMSLVGWEIEGKSTIDASGLIVLNLEARHFDAKAVTSHYGEGTGPIVTKAKTALGKPVEVVLTENKAMGASTSVTKTPLVLRARPGVSYPIQLRMGDKLVAAKITCSFGE
jgi:hypothetical protein